MHTSSHCDTVSVDAIVPIGIRLNVLKFSLILKRIPRVCIKKWKTILPRIDKQDFRSPHSHQYSLLDMDSLKQLTIICVIVNRKLWQHTLYTSCLFSYAFADASDIVITTQNAIQLSLFTYIDAFIKQIWYTDQHNEFDSFNKIPYWIWKINLRAF